MDNKDYNGGFEPTELPGEAAQIPSMPGQAASIPSMPGQAASIPSMPGQAASIPSMPAEQVAQVVQVQQVQQVQVQPVQQEQVQPVQQEQVVQPVQPPIQPVQPSQEFETYDPSKFYSEAQAEGKEQTRQQHGDEYAEFDNFNFNEYFAEGEEYYEEEEYIPESFRTTRFVTSETIAPVSLSKKEIKEIDKKNKELRKQYHVSNIQILKNFKKYSDEEKEHYRYLFGRRVASAVWPFFHYVILIGLAFVILYPILFMITQSIRPQIETTDPSTMWIPKNLRFENFSETFRAITTQNNNVIFNTFFINIGCSVVQVITCALAGYGFARFKFKGRNLLFGIVILQMIVPIQIVMLPLYIQFSFFDFFGIINLIRGAPLNLIGNPVTMFIMAFFTNGIRAGLFILLFRQFFRGLPKELEDAAYLDGCGPLATFVRIMVPNAFVSFLTVFIFSVVWYWNDSYVTGMLLGNDRPTIAVAIEGQSLWRAMSFALNNREIVGSAADYMVWVQAGCLMAIAPILLMYIFLQKHFVEGVERSGIVG
jgi:multiple sugar transport system permease protein